MEGICIGKGIVIGIKLMFGLFGYQTMGNCVYNKTAIMKFPDGYLNKKTLPAKSCEHVF